MRYRVMGENPKIRSSINTLKSTLCVNTLILADWLNFFRAGPGIIQLYSNFTSPPTSTKNEKNYPRNLNGNPAFPKHPPNWVTNGGVSQPREGRVLRRRRRSNGEGMWLIQTQVKVTLAHRIVTVIMMERSV